MDDISLEVLFEFTLAQVQPEDRYCIPPSGDDLDALDSLIESCLVSFLVVHLIYS